jgi:hypothetical protein
VSGHQLSMQQQRSKKAHRRAQQLSAGWPYARKEGVAIQLLCASRSTA